MAHIEQVCGNTFRVITKSMCIPFYRLNSTDIIMMDSGLASEWEELEAVLEENHYRVKALLTTHVHYDHVGNHNRLKEKYGAEIYMNTLDAGLSRSPLTLQSCFYMDTVTDIAATYPFMVCKPDHVFSHEDAVITVEGAEFKVLDLPGHAHSHVGYITPDNAAYIGDLLIGEEDLGHMSMVFGQCWLKALESIDAALSLNCPVYILAHNAVHTDLRDIAALNRKVILAQMEEVASCLEEWHTLEEVNALLAQRKMRRVNKDRVRFLSRLTISAARYLEDTGRLEFDVRNGMLYYRALHTDKKEGERA